jgi:transposase
LERSVGIDLHKNTFSVCVFNSEGVIESESKHRVSPASLDAFRCGLRISDTVCFEVSTSAWEMYDLLRDRVGRIIVANPMKTKLLSGGDPKTDKLDARRLAQLAQDKHIAEVWVPDRETREMREMVRFRQQLTNIKTRMGNVRLCRESLEAFKAADPYESIVGPKRSEARELMSECAQDIEKAACAQLAKLDSVFTRWALSDSRALRLMRHPGIGPFVAAAYISAMGDITRFPDSKKAASYTGLVPRVHASGETSYNGRITKAGRKELRHALVQAAWVAIRCDPELASFYRRIAKARGSGKAIVAVARKIAVRLWHLTVEGTCDGLMSEEKYTAKLARLISTHARQFASSGTIVSAAKEIAKRTFEAEEAQGKAERTQPFSVDVSSA